MKTISYKKLCKICACMLTQEKRQEFMDNIYKGLTIGEAREVCEITLDQALGIMDLNIKEVTILNRKSV